MLVGNVCQLFVSMFKVQESVLGDVAQLTASNGSSPSTWQSAQAAILVLNCVDRQNMNAVAENLTNSALTLAQYPVSSMPQLI